MDVVSDNGKYSYGNIMRTLAEARMKITAPERWTRGEYARDGDGNPCAPNDINACCWCSMGAIEAVADNPDDGHMAMEFLGFASTYLFLHQWNDDPETSHSDVLAAYDKAFWDAKDEAKRNGWKLGWKV